MDQKETWDITISYGSATEQFVNCNDTASYKLHGNNPEELMHGALIEWLNEKPQRKKWLAICSISALKINDREYYRSDLGERTIEEIRHNTDPHRGVFEVIEDNLKNNNHE